MSALSQNCSIIFERDGHEIERHVARDGERAAHMAALLIANLASAGRRRHDGGGAIAMRLLINTICIALVIAAVWQSLNERVVAALLLMIAALVVAFIRERFR